MHDLFHNNLQNDATPQGKTGTSSALHTAQGSMLYTRPKVEYVNSKAKKKQQH